MNRTATVAVLTIRISGILLILLGACFWAGRLRGLVPLHMLLGLLLVVALWIVALIGVRSGVSVAFTAGATAWGLLVLIFGMVQTRLLPGGSHWVIQVLHLLAGLAAMGIGESIARRIRAHAAA